MGIIAFLFSLLGRHSNRSGDLLRQRDEKRIEHILCQEQGEYTFYIAAKNSNDNARDSASHCSKVH